jgi:hypothetical protein
MALVILLRPSASSISGTLDASLCSTAQCSSAKDALCQSSDFGLRCADGLRTKLEIVVEALLRSECFKDLDRCANARNSNVIFNIGVTLFNSLLNIAQLIVLVFILTMVSSFVRAPARDITVSSPPAMGMLWPLLAFLALLLVALFYMVFQRLL